MHLRPGKKYWKDAFLPTLIGSLHLQSNLQAPPEVTPEVRVYLGTAGCGSNTNKTMPVKSLKQCSLKSRELINRFFADRV